MIPRAIEPQLRRLAAQFPVITITGPRQSGKTTLARNYFKEFDYVNLEEPETRAYAQEDPKGFLGTIRLRSSSTRCSGCRSC